MKLMMLDGIEIDECMSEIRLNILPEIGGPMVENAVPVARASKLYLMKLFDTSVVSNSAPLISITAPPINEVVNG